MTPESCVRTIKKPESVSAEAFFDLSEHNRGHLPPGLPTALRWYAELYKTTFFLNRLIGLKSAS